MSRSLRRSEKDLSGKVLGEKLDTLLSDKTLLAEIGNNAKKNGVYVLKMNGDVEKVSRYSRKKVEPGCEIVVPRKKIRRSMTTGEIVTIGTSTASLATMIVTMISLLKK